MLLLLLDKRCIYYSLFTYTQCSMLSHSMYMYVYTECRVIRLMRAVSQREKLEIPLLEALYLRTASESVQVHGWWVQMSRLLSLGLSLYDPQG